MLRVVGVDAAVEIVRGAGGRVGLCVGRHRVESCQRGETERQKRERRKVQVSMEKRWRGWDASGNSFSFFLRDSRNAEQG